ncbi:hypothetical protein KRR38_08675 [Novosphingobium sp. G106]|uniref:hypothetical protein n=1 Tax=Novosphingobium sp. G106 TaxID=2849500 RepID=UPI001C2DECB0|nr:hypothetical protein [Novosphingobium sp. G106]MBV1687746.1 hypothetical protein [Novosphingobium sp. G106]
MIFSHILQRQIAVRGKNEREEQKHPSYFRKFGLTSGFGREIFLLAVIYGRPPPILISFSSALAKGGTASERFSITRCNVILGDEIPVRRRTADSQKRSVSRVMNRSRLLGREQSETNCRKAGKRRHDASEQQSKDFEIALERFVTSSPYWDDGRHHSVRHQGALKVRRKFMYGSAAVGLTGAALIATAALTADYCSRWNPLSCHGPDPTLMKYAR